ncbi:MAG: mevalonate kinase [Legionella sp. 40-6]|nr:MAG: mevalonate kinase [Legionella sp. 40-6]
MKFCNYSTTTYGKWILAGEHAVVRGHAALVFPVKEKKLKLTYESTSQTLGADYTGSSGADMHLLFWSVLEYGVKLLGHSLNELQGHFLLDNQIPIGAGMGASAALCVAMSRWFVAQNLIAPERCISFAKELEHLFHGKSSGLDVAGVATQQGIYFKAGEIMPLEIYAQPHFYLSTCKQIGITAHCIRQVQILWDHDPDRAQAIDLQMANAVELAKQALTQQVEFKDTLIQAIEKAAECFAQWGLISNDLQQHMQWLKNKGALAVKPTGSGGGGYVLSLWDSPPPVNLNLLAV